MTLSESPKEQAMREFMGDVCSCGKPKKRGRSFCGRCYFTLPEPMRNTLFARFGRGYEENYEAAKDWLREEAKAGKA